MPIHEDFITILGETAYLNLNTVMSILLLFNQDFGTTPIPPEPTVYAQLSVTITFQVSLINYQLINQSSLPDSRTNIIYNYKHIGIAIPGVGRLVYDGDVFTLTGQNALDVKATYVEKDKVLIILSELWTYSQNP